MASPQAAADPAEGPTFAQQQLASDLSFVEAGQEDAAKGALSYFAPHGQMLPLHLAGSKAVAQCTGVDGGHLNTCLPACARLPAKNRQGALPMKLDLGPRPTRAAQRGSPLRPMINPL